MCPGLVHWWAHNLNDQKRFLSLENSSTVFWTLQIATHLDDCNSAEVYFILLWLNPGTEEMVENKYMIIKTE